MGNGADPEGAVPFFCFLNKVIGYVFVCFNRKSNDFITCGGFPFFKVEDGDYLRKGELFVKHYFEGIELDVKYIEKTIPYLYYLWGRPVHLQTVIEGREVIFVNDGMKTHRKFL